jgi:hypothetical protein
MVCPWPIGETMIEVGDLVKFESIFPSPAAMAQRDKGVWLVVYAEDDSTFGRLVTLKKGGEKRKAHVSHLYKISSDR